MMADKINSVAKAAGGPSPSQPSHQAAHGTGRDISFGDVDRSVVSQMGGNLAMQQLLRSSRIQAKFAISHPSDHDEREADQVAEDVMRHELPALTAPDKVTSTRKCAACDAGGSICPKCQDEKIVQRKNIADQTSDINSSERVRLASLLGSGQPLPMSVRAFFEPRFGRDFSKVRVHNDSTAADSARAIKAKAFTAGHDVAFGAGEYAPESHEGRKLLAHELTHTLQQDGDHPVALRRAPLDPANPGAWNWYDSDAHRKDASYLQTVAAAPGTAKNLEKKFAATEAPKTDAEREAFEKEVLALIRLNAVAMVGQHRNELTARQRQFEDMAANPQPTSGAASQAAGGANPKAADTANAIRKAAQTITRLSEEKSQLEKLRDTIAASVRVNAGPEAIDEEYQTLWNSGQPNSTPWVLQRLLETRDRLHGRDLAWGSKKVVLMELRNDLRKLRDKQIQGIELSQALTYNSFPFLADLKLSWIEKGKENSDTTGKVKAFGLGLGALVIPALAPYAAMVAHDVFKKDAPPDDQTLLSAVGASFQRLLQHTDEAMVKVGSGGIHPLDLPGAVSAARNGLPEPLRPEVDRLKQEHEAIKFAEEMVLALGIAVLTGFTGGFAGIGLAAYAAGTGAAAAGIGVVQLGSQLKDMLDRQTLAAASTNPDGTLLGVSAPSLFEWTMFGVTALLTAADLAAVAKEVGALRPAFNEEAHLPSTKSEPHGTGGSAEGESANAQRPSDPAGTPESTALETGKMKPANPAEARILETGKGDAVPSIEQIESELVIVQSAEPRKLPGELYVEEVELPNGHTWRRSSSKWCRFSGDPVCVPKAPRKVGQNSVSSIDDLEKMIEMRRPTIERPPATVKTPEDQAMWELYNNYFTERVNSMRTDLKTTGKTKRQQPRDFDDFRKHYTENPELIAALRGRMAQGDIGNAISKITGGKTGQNIGISRLANPVPGDVVYPDFLWRGKRGYTAVSNKSRDFRNMSAAEVKRTVIADMDEAFKKYHGTSYVRRPGLDVTGKKIDIAEVILNYDPALIPEELRAHIYAKQYRGGSVEVAFFDLTTPL